MTPKKSMREAVQEAAASGRYMFPQSAARRPHPTLSDVALALATRRSDPVSKVSLTWNAKGDVQIDVDVTDTDPKVAAESAAALFDVLRAKYPRETP